MINEDWYFYHRYHKERYTIKVVTCYYGLNKQIKYYWNNDTALNLRLKF